MCRHKVHVKVCDCKYSQYSIKYYTDDGEVISGGIDTSCTTGINGYNGHNGPNQQTTKNRAIIYFGGQSIIKVILK